MSTSNTTRQPNVKDLKNLNHCLALGFGSGLFPKAPGTAGTLVAVLILFVVAWATGFVGQMLPLATHLLAIIVTSVAGIFICTKMTNALGTNDHGAIVFDEFVGFWLAMLCVPITWYWLLLAFIIFRFFDIIKPFPINWLDNNLHSGLGIMADDLMAGLYSLVVLQSLIWLLPPSYV